MAYQPLALKYRPLTFNDVVGQEVVTTTLRNAIEGGRIGHAYLFSGMRGVGKTTAARILAKCLNCRSFDAPTTEPCNQCESCSEITTGRSIDVLEIDGASNTSVDDVRALQENLIYAPARDRFKIYIVDEVHMLSKSAFNAFLKTLEEPPAHVVFVFATTEIHKIPATVLSRCMLFDFGRVSSEAIASRLKMICDAEKVGYDDAAIDLIVFGSEGSIRDAVSALDQAINFCGENITYDDTLKALGLIDRDVLHRFMKAVVEQNSEAAFSVVREMSDTGTEMRLFCRQLIRHVRDLLVARAGAESANLLPYNDQELSLLREQAKGLSEEDLSRFFDILVKADGEMPLSGTPQYLLEAAAIKMIHSTRLTPLTEIIARVEAGELSAPAALPPPSPIEQKLEFGDSKQLGSRFVPSGTDRERLMAAVRGTSVHRILDMAAEIRKEEDKIVVFMPLATGYRNLTKAENLEQLKAAVRDLFGENMGVEIVESESFTQADPASEEPGLLDEEPPLEDKEDYSSPEFEPTGETKVVEGTPADVERKVRRDPKAGRLFQELELTLDKVHEAEPKEEEEQ